VAQYYEGWVERAIGAMKRTTKYTTTSDPEARAVNDALLRQALSRERLRNGDLLLPPNKVSRTVHPESESMYARLKKPQAQQIALSARHWPNLKCASKPTERIKYASSINCVW
jgi:hypothetical protein